MLRFSRLGAYEKHGILTCFCEDMKASSASTLSKIKWNTINLPYKHFRELIVQQSFQENPRDFGVFELDEITLRAERVRRKRGRGAARKTPVFGLLKREGQVFVSMGPNCSKEELMPIIQGKILERSTVHTDGWSAYDGLVVNG